jgi:hypothetical protein
MLHTDAVWLRNGPTHSSQAMPRPQSRRQHLHLVAVHDLFLDDLEGARSYAHDKVKPYGQGPGIGSSWGGHTFVRLVGR